MYRFRKVLSILLLFVMALSFVPAGALVFDFEAKAYDWTTSFSWSGYDSTNLPGKPGVYIMGDGYAIIWVTSFNGTGSVTFLQGGKEVTVYDERTGIVRTNDTIHVVKLTPEQYECVQENGYIIESKEVYDHRYALTNYQGATVQAGPINVAATPTAAALDTLVLTDIHGDETDAKAVANMFVTNNGQPDLYIFPGDICEDTIDTKQDIEEIFSIMGNITSEMTTVKSGDALQVPSVYVRGNHECRGVVSTLLLEYLPTSTGQYYFDFTYGSLWGVVIDTTEDKRPDDAAYGDWSSTSGSVSMVNYEKYLREQQMWLRNLSSPTSSNVKIKLGIYHIPDLASIGSGTSGYSVDMSDSIHHLDLDIAVSGHDHTVVPKFTITNVEHDTIVCGGHIKGGSSYKSTANDGYGGTPSIIASNNPSGVPYIDKYVGTWMKLDSEKGHAKFSSRFYNGMYYGRHCANYNMSGEPHIVMKDQIVSFPDGPDSSTRYPSKYSAAGETFPVHNTAATINKNLSPASDDYTDTKFRINGALPEPNKQDSLTYNYTVSGKTHTVKNIELAVQPVVFETGGDWYNVVWVSDLNSYNLLNDNTLSGTEGVMGFIQYEYQGEIYQVFDEVAGFRRAYDNIHTVRVPKAHLSNNEYFVGSVSVSFDYTNRNALTGRFYHAGECYVTSPEYLFMDRSEDKTPNILTFADLKYPTNDRKGFVEQATQGLGTAASFIVVAGNAVQTTTGDRHPDMSETLTPNSYSSIGGECKTGLPWVTGILVNDPLANRTDKDNRSYDYHDRAYYSMLPSIFDACADASHSIHPIIFSRGMNECRGMFATDLIRYLPTITGEFYYTVNIGDFTYYNMDTTEDDPTDAMAGEVSKYGNRIDSNALKIEQDEYMQSVFGGVDRHGNSIVKTDRTGYTDNGEKIKDKVVVISNLSLDILDNRSSTGKFKDLFGDGLGCQWGRYLKQHGAIINLTRPKLAEDLSLTGSQNTLFGLERNVHERQMFTVRSGGYALTGYNASADLNTGYSSATSVLLAEDYAYIANCLASGKKSINRNGESIVLNPGTVSYECKEYTVSLTSGEEIIYSPEEPQFVGDTYYLSTPSHMAWLSEQVNNSTTVKSAKFALQNDIDLMLKPFTPIGGYRTSSAGDGYGDGADETDAFSGIFEGNGYKIKNLHILPSMSGHFSTSSLESEVGLFGAIANGTIKNLTVEGGFIKASGSTGALVGNITNGSATNCYTNVTVFAPVGSNVAGFAGLVANNVTFDKCANYGNVLSKAAKANVGGIAGSFFSFADNDTCKAEFYNCYNRGHIISQSNALMGGIVGRISRKNISIRNCYNASSIISTDRTDNDNNKIGAIIGEISNTNDHWHKCFEFFNCMFDPSYNGGVYDSNYDSDPDVSKYNGDRILKASGRIWVTYDTSGNGVMMNEGTSYGGEGSVYDRGTFIWADNQPSLRNNETTTNTNTLNTLNTYNSRVDSSSEGQNAYVSDGSINYVEGGDAGIINDGYPIHKGYNDTTKVGLMIHAPEHVVTRDEVFNGSYVAKDDAVEKGNEANKNNLDYKREENVNKQFSTANGNITNLNQMANGYMYVLLESGGSYRSTSGNSALNYDSASSYVWKLEKTASGFTLSNGSTKIATNATLTKDSSSDTLYTISDLGKYNILPIIQDNDKNATYGFTGRVDGGVSSTISSLSVTTNHEGTHDRGLCDTQYNSVFGNNIFYYENGTTYGNDQCIVVDMLSLSYRQKDAPWHLPDSFMTAPDATGQLMDMACDNTTYAWEISPSNKASLALQYSDGMSFATDSAASNQRFFIAYSLNADGGYYIIPASTGKVALGVKDGAGNEIDIDGNKETKDIATTHDLVASNFVGSSAERFWIQSNEEKIVAEVVDVLVRFDRDGNIIPETVQVREETRFYNELYYNSAFYNPDGFWTDIYDGYVYAFDSIDTVSESSIVCYRYFRPKVVHVTYTSNLPESPIVADRIDGISNDTKLEQINVDNLNRPTRYYYDGKLQQYGNIDVMVADSNKDIYFTDSFKISYDSNGGGNVSAKTYDYTLAGWYSSLKDTNIDVDADVAEFTTTTMGDHDEVVLAARWQSVGMEHQDGSTRDLHVFYGWNRPGWNLPSRNDTTVNNDNDFETEIPPVAATHLEEDYQIRKNTTVYAYWVGADLSGLEEQRVWDDSEKQTGTWKDHYTVIAKLFDETKAINGYFKTLQTNSNFAWDKATTNSSDAYQAGSITGTTSSAAKATETSYSENQKEFYYYPTTDDRGYAIRAQFKYNSKDVKDVYAFSALIAVNVLVDSTENKEDDYKEAEWFTKYNVTGSVASKGTTTIAVPTDDKQRVNAVTTSTSGITYKVYGIWKNGNTEYKILVVDNGIMVLEQDGGVSLDGIVFSRYEVEVKNTTSSKVNFNIDVQTNPYIYQLIINNDNNKGYINEPGEADRDITINADVEYVGEKETDRVFFEDGDVFVGGERAKPASNNNRYFYVNDVIRAKIPTADGNKLGAGSYFIVEGVKDNEDTKFKVFPTYSTTSTLDVAFGKTNNGDDNVYVPLLNGLDVLLKNGKEQYIVFSNTEMKLTFYASLIDNAEKGNVDDYHNINIGPLGAKINKTGESKIRFGIVWYLDDVVTENRWYRVHTDPQNGPTFGGYIIPLDNLLRIEDDTNDFWKYMNEKYPSIASKTAFNKLTEEVRLGYLREFIAQWNKNANADHIDVKMSFGSYESTVNPGEIKYAASDVGGFMYYYHPGKMNEITGVREAVVEYSLLLNIPEAQKGTKVVYIPYASYVYDWNYGFMANQPAYPQNIYIYSAPEYAYSYNTIANAY